MAFCALWIPSAYGVAISRRLGSPVFVLPAVILVYAAAPLIASFSKLGRDYWDMLGRGGTARQAVVKLLIFAALTLLLAVGSRAWLR